MEVVGALLQMIVWLINVIFQILGLQGPPAAGGA